MDDTAAILDYASPRKRGRLRLPATSRVTVTASDGRVTVEESLAGQPEAIAGLAFGALVVGLCTVGAVTQVRTFALGLFRPDQIAAAVFAGLALAELATMVAVVQQTWRRTRLVAEYDELRLAFLSPLRRRHYRWTGEQIADVVVTLTANVETAAPLAEVLITRVAGGDVRLFTDHPARRLGPIARAVHDVLRDGHAGPVATTDLDAPLRDGSAPAPSADLLPRAEQTAGRLVDLHRTLRERRGGETSPAQPPSQD